MGEQFSTHRRRHGRPTIEYIVHRSDESRHWHVLCHVAGRTGLDRLEEVLGRFTRREEDHPTVRADLLQGSDDLQSGHAGHQQIEHHQIWGVLTGEIDSRHRVGSHCHDFETLLVEGCSQTLSEQLRIIDY